MQADRNEEDMEVITEHCRCSDDDWTGFKIVGDNIDKTVRPRHYRSDQQTKSLHYFHAYAVKDRINLASLSDFPPIPPENPDLLSLLPSNDDVVDMKHLFEIHIARIIVEHIPFMKVAFADVVDWHITHAYYEEMVKMSDVVSYFMF